MDLTLELLDPLYLFYFLFVKKTHWPNIAFNIILFYYLINLCLFSSLLHINGIHLRQARRNYQFVPQILWQVFEHQSSNLLSNWVLFKKVRKTAPLKPVKRLQAIWWKKRDQHWNHFTCQSIFVLALVKPVKEPIIHKMGNSEIVRSFAKASRDSSTLQIPTRVLTSLPWLPVMHVVCACAWVWQCIHRN